MKRNVKIVNILICLVLVTTILSTSGAAGLLKNKESKGINILEENESVKIILRGRIKDLETNGSTISFIPIKVVVIIKINYMGFRHSEKLVMEDTDERIYLEGMGDFRGIYTQNYIWGFYQLDISDIQE